jgi:hypothetical protein
VVSEPNPSTAQVRPSPSNSGNLKLAKLRSPEPKRPRASNTTPRRSAIACRSDSRTAPAASGGSTSSMVRPITSEALRPTSASKVRLT